MATQPAPEQALECQSDATVEGSTNLQLDQEKSADDDPAPEGGVRAWLVAGGGAAVFFCTLGFANSFGTFEEYYLSHQMKGESASKVSWIGSLAMFLQFFAGVVGGPLFDRYGETVRPQGMKFVTGPE